MVIVILGGLIPSTALELLSAGQMLHNFASKYAISE